MAVDKFVELSFKKKNNHKCHPQPNVDLSSSSLHAFHSHVSKLIAQLALKFKPESETLSLSWFQRCFSLLPFINNAFAKLLADSDYPMSQWKVDSIEENLNYTMSLLELLNSISSSLSHLGQTTLSLARGLNLTLVEKEKSHSLAQMYLKAIQPSGCFSSIFGKGNEEYWIYGDCKTYMELRKIAGGFENSLVGTLDFQINEKVASLCKITNSL